MERRKRYRSISEMARALSDDKAFADGVDRQIGERNIINHLMALRATLGKSQKDIALAMGCSQSRVSKLESGKDDDLRIGDFAKYAAALGLEMMVVLGKNDRTIVDDIKGHALSIRRLFGQLIQLGKSDPSIAEGVKAFIAGEAAYNISRFLVEAAEKAAKAAKAAKGLPRPRSQQIRIEIQGDDDSECADAAGDAYAVPSNN